MQLVVMLSGVWREGLSVHLVRREKGVIHLLIKQEEAEASPIRSTPGGRNYAARSGIRPLPQGTYHPGRGGARMIPGEERRMERVYGIIHCR
jgi:hypothetical protein